MYLAAVDVSAHAYRVVQGTHCEVGFHPRSDGIPHDPPRECILDGAKIELAFSSWVLRNVREPQVIDNVCFEPVAGNAVLILIRTQIIMNWRARFLPILAFLLPKSGPPLVF